MAPKKDEPELTPEEKKQRKLAEQVRVASLDREGKKIEKRRRITDMIANLERKLASGDPRTEALQAKITRLRQDYAILGFEAEAEAIRKERRRPQGGPQNVSIEPPAGQARVTGGQP